MNNIKKLLEEIQEEFEQAIKTADDIYYDGDITTKKDGYDSLRDYLSSKDNKFFNSTIYPEESPWELDPEKVKSFIKESNLRVIEKVKEIVENVKITATRRFDGDDIEEKAKLMQEIYDEMIKPVLLSALTEQN